ncbi:MAG: hypothetical protein RLZZ401_2304 [Pseudomonadota bacterium]|jgi:cytochrome c
MSSCLKFGVALAVAWVLGTGLSTALAQTVVSAGSKYPGVGRAATPQEVTAWDIDVRPDFKGLSAGSGSVASGQHTWEAKCAGCHGVFGEANEVFSPLVGGTTASDIKTGRVASLRDPSYPGRTTLMKVATLSTLWDYINRAMPWNQPKSLTVDEVYAVTAYMLNLGGVVANDFVLSHRNMADVQARLPNRNGMQTQHALWPGPEFGGLTVPDTRNVACMSNCRTDPKVASILPAFARNAHGNLAEQNRTFGAQRGADTTQVEGGSAVMVMADPAVEGKAVQTLLQKNTCTACHAQAGKLVGPAFADIAKRHAGKSDYLAGKIKAGGAGAWGAIPMAPQSLSDADARTIANWLASGASK